jgi:hypothetical protein
MGFLNWKSPSNCTTANWSMRRSKTDRKENDSSFAKGESVVTEVRCTFTSGRACDQAMIATRGRFGVYLRCSDPSCPGKRSISR